MNIELVSASAGTGKTYFLSHRLPELVQSGEVAPDRILATTFTNKAADELVNRIRTELLRDGKTDQARKLTLSYIGTVNSVCGRLLKDFAFELGMSPELEVANENLTTQLLNEAIGEVATEDEIAELTDLADRFSSKGNPYRGSGLDGWREDLEELIDRTRSNGMSVDDLEKSKNRSIKQLNDTLFQEPEIKDLDKQLKEVLTSYDQGLAQKKQAAADAVLNDLLPKWSNWQKLAAEMPQKAACIEEVAVKYPRHPQFRKDMRRQIELVFDLAIRCLHNFQERKKNIGVLDFTDQESKLLELLNRPHILELIASKFDLVMVDEFQDTSPLELAIFIKLASKVNNNIWVGDQKQAIYGFRGTDPELMNAVVAAVEEGGSPPKILNESWRSRAGLVKFTSDLFASAFHKSIDLPEDRVRITVAEKAGEEPEGLGECLEVWKVNGGNVNARAEGLARHVVALLNDDSVQIWHHRDDPVPRLRVPEDIAVLATKNAQCDQIALALKSLGVPVKRGAAGLLKTPEVRLILAAMKLWLDPRDKLAKAELIRLVSPDECAEEWLQKLLANDDSLQEHKVVTAILEAAEAHAGAGVSLVLNKAIELLPLSKLMQEWGNFDQRVANIGAIRKHLETYLDEAKALGNAQTLAGFLVWINKLAAKNLDESGLTATNAVTVSTWHKAKGLEWPIVVLVGWDNTQDADPFGVGVITNDTVSLINPLANRWIRYWANPLSGNIQKSVLGGLLEKESIRSAELDKKERLRCLYVAMTRPRTRLILAQQQVEMPEIISDSLVIAPNSKTLSLNGREYQTLFRELPELDDMDNVGQPTSSPSWYSEPDCHPEYPPARLQPSAIPAVEGILVGQFIPLGDRIPVSVEKPNYASLGNAVHAFLAADMAEASKDSRKEMAERLLSGHNVKDSIGVDSLLQITDRLTAWITENYPTARGYREVPFCHPLDNGTIIEGSADLVLETDKGFVIIDHKTFPGSREQCIEKAKTFSGQINAYAEALEAAVDKKVLETYIHFPISGYLIGIEGDSRKG